MDKQKILIVDDDHDIRTLLDITLKAQGYETAFAADATMALTAARQERPDLILLDLGLPGGTGLSVIERLKNFPAFAHLPVIVVSARDPSVSKTEALAAGARAFISKPIDQAELREAIVNALGETS